MRSLRQLTDPAKNNTVAQLGSVARELVHAAATSTGVVASRTVSTVITGATPVDQIRENMKALDVLSKLMPDVLSGVDANRGPKR